MMGFASDSSKKSFEMKPGKQAVFKKDYYQNPFLYA